MLKILDENCGKISSLKYYNANLFEKMEKTQKMEYFWTKCDIQMISRAMPRGLKINQEFSVDLISFNIILFYMQIL